MGNYASVADLKARFRDDTQVAGLTDDDESGTPDTAVLNEVIDDSEGVVDGYVAMRMQVPVDVSSDTVLAARMKSLTLDLAVHRLLVRADAESAVKERANDEAMEFLKLFSEGKVMLPSATTLPSTDSRDPVASWGTAGTGDDSKRIFSRATMDNL